MKILVFAPHSAIWVHALPEALVVEALQQAGHQVTYVACGRVFGQLCVSMGAYGVGIDASLEQKQRICATCDANKNIIRKSFRFAGPDLAQLVDSADTQWIEMMLASVTRDNYLSLAVDGVEVGKCALSHFLISRKKSNLDFSAAEWRRFQVELRNTLNAFVGIRKLMDAEKPDRVMVYVAAYSVNFVCCELARVRGIPHYYMAAAGNLSDRLRHLVLARGHAMHFQKNTIRHWKDIKDLPCAPGSLSYVTEHFRELLRGKNPFVYSAPAQARRLDLRQSYGIATEQKVLLATMSSDDEIYASQVVGLWPADFESIFPTQIAWIQAMIEFVGRRSDLFLLIRVHPREFPNRRDSGLSDSAQKFQELLVSLPPNVKVNWPSDQISMYDIAEITEVCLNAWSSAGKELCMLGIPVVTYAPDQVAFPPELNYVSDTREGYFDQIERALAKGWSVDHMRAAYRWYVLEYEKAMIDLSESYSGSENQTDGLPRRAFNRARRAINPHYRQLRDCANRAPRLNQAPIIVRLLEDARDSILDLRVELGFEPVSIEDETAGLKRETGRLLEIMYGGRGATRTNTLKYKLENFVNTP